MEEQTYQELVSSHVGYAERVAKKFYREYRHDLLEFDDIRSAAYVGLCRAASRYQSSRGVKFRTFSYMRIRGAMYDLLRNDISPFSGRRAVNEARSIDEAANSSGSSSVNFQLLHGVVARTIEELGITFNGTNFDEELEVTYLNDSSPEDASTKKALCEFVISYIDNLPEKDREVVQRKYYKDQSFPEIAPHLNDVRTSWLCRIHSRALDRLRGMMHEEDAKEWLVELAQ